VELDNSITRQSGPQAHERIYLVTEAASQRNAAEITTYIVTYDLNCGRSVRELCSRVAAASFSAKFVESSCLQGAPVRLRDSIS
jgi:hypothetical protein